MIDVALGDYESFNPRTRMGCDHSSPNGTSGFKWFQSTHPHGVRLYLADTEANTFKCVSIHAPAWGATLADTEANTFKCVSIHAPAWGATLGIL